MCTLCCPTALCTHQRVESGAAKTPVALPPLAPAGPAVAAAQAPVFLARRSHRFSLGITRKSLCLSHFNVGCGWLAMPRTGGCCHGHPSRNGRKVHIVRGLKPAALHGGRAGPGRLLAVRRRVGPGPWTLVRSRALRALGTTAESARRRRANEPCGCPVLGPRCCVVRQGWRLHRDPPRCLH